MLQRKFGLCIHRAYTYFFFQVMHSSQILAVYALFLFLNKSDQICFLLFVKEYL